MKDTRIQKTERKKEWSLTESPFRHLLAWLDGETNADGEKYMEMRRRLVSYFDRKNCLAPDELADETLNRVARRLEEEGSITGDAPAQYCYIVAKFVFLEYLRRAERGEMSFDNMPLSGHPAHNPAAISKQNDEKEREEVRLDCLEQCLQKLEPENRELIIEYYQGEQRARIENRRLYAERLSIKMNALSIRACRIRDKLEACVNQCPSKVTGDASDL